MSMIGLTDCIRAVSALVETTFGEPPTTKDITEGFDRPCTYVQPAVIQSSVEGGMRHDTYEIEIIRFAARTREGYLELLDYQSRLVDVLEKPIPVGDMFLLYPEDVDFSLQREDMLLIATFSVDNLQVLPVEEPEDTMEILAINGKE